MIIFEKQISVSNEVKIASNMNPDASISRFL
jgi:hypothetical protein